MLRRSGWFKNVRMLCGVLTAACLGLACGQKETSERVEVVEDTLTPVIIKVSELGSLKVLPNAPLLFYYTAEEWALAVGEIESTDEPMPLDVPHLQANPVFGLTPDPGMLVQFVCLSPDKDTRCVPRFGLDSLSGQEVIRCFCGSDPDTTGLRGRVLPDECSVGMETQGEGLWRGLYCVLPGWCKEGRECNLAFRSQGGNHPFQIWCPCL